MINIYGITRMCEWGKVQDCNVGWGCANSDGVESCLGGSASKNCNRIVRILLGNLDKKSIKRLEKLGDIEEG